MFNERIGNVTLTQTVGSPYYYARYRRDGRQVARSLKTADIEKARAEALAISEKVARPAKAPRGDHSFNRFAEEVIAADERRIARGEKNPRLAADQRRILRCHCAEPLGSLDVRRVTANVLEEFVDELRDKELSPATIKIVLVLVSKTMQAATRAGAIDHGPRVDRDRAEIFQEVERRPVCR